MTLPASGAISISQFNTEYGQAATYAGSLSWIQANAKAGQNAYDMGSYHGKAYYQRTVDGNCNNGNCPVANCNCGIYNCNNCIITGAVNCANCDARPWLQTNCNCACTYNCTVGTVMFDCQCNCKASDDRLKVRYGNISNALSKVMSLDGFYYEYNKIAQDRYNQTIQKEVGVSAQQVQQVLPEIVFDDGMYLSVDYARITPLLIEAIKELSNTVDTLKSKIEKFEK